jgi:outer membrane protein insertion porin family
LKRFLLLVVALFVGLFSSLSYAEDKVVEKVEVVGNETIPDSTILFYISEKPGEVYSPTKVARDIKTLFKLGYFENISVDVKEGKKGVVLRYFVKEKPIITGIVFKGNEKVSSSKLKEELGLVDENGEEKEIREPLSYKYLDDLARKIESIYEKKGFPGTKVSYTIDRTSPTRAVVTFVIKEGRKANVCTIEVKGNRAISSGDIKDVLVTKEKSWLHLRFTAPLSTANLEEDVERIKELYHSRGYLDVEVGKPKVVREKDDCYKVIYTI